MAVHSSFQLELGAPAPAFSLTDVVSGNTVSRDDFAGRPLLVMFICSHCPYVKHVEPELSRIGAEYGETVGIVGICSNDPEAHPEDAPDGLREQAERARFRFPYLHDETQEVAKAYGAACTPDFFLFGSDHRLAYRGRMDDSRPNSGISRTGFDLRSALDAVGRGGTPSKVQLPSIGCGIKWKPGNEPG